MNPKLELFKKHGMDASHHYADDSCKEWGLASKSKSYAMTIFNDNPELQDEMRVIAKGFLWSLER